MSFAACTPESFFNPSTVSLLSPEDIKPCLRNLESFIKRYEPRFYRVEQREHARIILEGLLGDLPRKTIEPIAIDHHRRRRALQNFVGAGLWNDAKVIDELQTHVVEVFGDSQGVLVIDPSSFPKKGVDSVGVERQWCGRLGKVENCQLGVYLSYVSSRGGTLIDHELFLPEAWANDQERRDKVDVPDSVTYRTTAEIADELLLKDSARFPHSWVVADDEFGRVTWFRYRLGDRNERYLLEVPSNTLVRDLEADPPAISPKGGRPPKAPLVHVSDWVRSQPAKRWSRLGIRNGEKGPLEVEAIRSRVETRCEGKIGREETLIVTRTLAADPEYKFWLAPSAVAASLEELVWAASMRHRVEEFFEWAKGAAGLSHYELRSWVGWHHHMTLSLLALLFLVLEHQRVGEKITRHHGLHDLEGCLGSLA